MSAICFDHVDEVFGQRPEAAFPLIDQALSRDDIFDRTCQLVAVRDACLRVEEGEMCVLMGLSGSGKSSLLRAINGLNPISRGQLTVRCAGAEVDMANCSARQLREVRTRGIAMVFQNFALMPWLNVEENVAFGLHALQLSAKESKRRVDTVLEQVGLGRRRYALPAELSGGMQQRVGLARALAVDSDILLMDEPFSALDPLIRNQLQDELLSLQKTLRKTIVFVSHDMDEALKLGSHIAILRDGQIVQNGTPQAIMFQPADDYVRQFVKHSNPLNVLSAASLMRPGHFPGLEQIMSAAQNAHSAVQYWHAPEPLSLLRAKPTVVDADIRLREAFAVYAQTGCELILAQDGKMVGCLSGAQMSRAILGQAA
ncbi:quaternary amine ABC transporter ATP-binding protein [Iodobacter fluviatilis]|uniref:Glycine betaine/L-proline transport ATP-binding protein ProV n=1 Tax=Iodobacter fluviatilis TaxID=537 RepID=A0A377Q3B0_9NEIS|nr:ATP-binding cassette domain-containing protein [Iodobacter fluviatilis]TCU90032.1 glycine betaine/proline transport system ATP-binding protein [Iodobacter fluviatilis]STQ89059.1 Glycine betaine/L-proline transport ATP-binding protein ProV [Iodobacter fluviatilis]